MNFAAPHAANVEIRKKTKPTGLSRRERVRHRNRCEILDAAGKLLAEKGYENTTMQEIADLADFAVGSLYRFFPNKRALFETLIREAWRDVGSRLREALETPGDEMTRLRAYLHASLDLILKHKTIAKIYFRHSEYIHLNFYAGLEGEFLRISKQLVNRLEEIFRSGIRKGIFVPIDPRVLALGFDSVCCSYLSIALGKENAIPLETWRLDLERMFFGPVLRQPAST